jgi:hypothetical protein
MIESKHLEIIKRNLNDDFWYKLSVHEKDLTEEFIWDFREDIDINRAIKNNKEHLSKEFILKIVSALDNKELKFKEYRRNLSSTWHTETDNLDFSVLKNANLSAEDLFSFLKKDEKGNIIPFNSRNFYSETIRNYHIFYCLYNDYELTQDFIIEYFDFIEAASDVNSDTGKKMKFKGYDMRKPENNELKLFLKLKGRL